MEHNLYSDGNAKSISWVIETEKSVTNQKRVHAEIYYDLVSDEQSRYIAYHVGLFWCIGTFRIKNSDTVNVMLDSESMYNHLAKNSTSTDNFISKRTEFINLLIKQRGLKINYKLIDSENNLARKNQMSESELKANNAQ